MKATSPLSDVPSATTLPCLLQSTAETTAAQNGTFRAGFGKADITPQDPSVPMGGYHSDTSKRMSTGLLSYLYAFAVAVQDGEGNTAMLVSVDMCGMSVTMMDEVRGWAQRELGIPQENIIISSIHQHSTPDPDNAKEETSVRYRNLLIAELQKAMKAAVEDLAPAEIYVNTVTTEALSFVRNYWTKNGTMAGTNYKIEWREGRGGSPGPLGQRIAGGGWQPNWVATFRPLDELDLHELLSRRLPAHDVEADNRACLFEGLHRR